MSNWDTYIPSGNSEWYTRRKGLANLLSLNITCSELVKSIPGYTSEGNEGLCWSEIGTEMFTEALFILASREKKTEKMPIKSRTDKYTVTYS